ncbi:MAG: DUF490 domain-containing protein [Confluentimicrobium sp.]|uniref:translocation/assembly module TamB domain-containing protein n=1 Tax=Actibacterium sp. TaxID=1872125 RepID=UPI000C374423|nr:translocation/assembly module TamB domain-containing protein [Actibacterium sp.]MBC55356.1 DUF490 domain-containing protein [Actibacterium sp.]
MRHFLTILFALFLPLAALAQDTSETDRGLLQGFIEDNLSDAGREVRISGFEGALSSRATIDELTIADDDGIWLTLRGVVLDWSRAALLRGRLEVRELSAAEILLPRLPGAGAGAKPPETEAKPFQLPDLPVSVQIGLIRAEKVSLGAALLGAAADVSLEGSMELAGGAGQAALTILRIDGTAGRFALDAAYSNETDVLKLDLDLSEEEDGILSNLIGLPGTPALDLTVVGEAPLSDYTAEILLSSDGQERLSGQIRQTAVASTEGAPPVRQFSGDVGGDITPLFAPDLRPFFGPYVSLSFTGMREPDGRLELSSFSLSSSAMVLGGNLVIGADGLPERFGLDGLIGAEGPVLLPVSGPETWVEQAEIAASFDASDGDQWTLSAAVAGLLRDGLSIDAITLAGGGTISRGDLQSVTADLDATASGIAHANADLARALGEDLTVSASLVSQEGEALRLTRLEVEGAGLQLTAQGQVGGVEAGFPVDGSLRLISDDISRFSGLAGQNLSGAAEVTVTGRATALSGAFDADVIARTTGLGIGMAQIDPLLGGETVLEATARRDEDGTTLDRFVITNDAVSATAKGTIDRNAANLDLQARLSELSLVMPELSGPATLDAAIRWAKDAPVILDRLEAEAMGTHLSGEGTLDLADETLPVASTLRVSAADLGRFSALAGRPLGGGLEAVVSGAGAVKGSDFDLTLEAQGQNLAGGLGDIDKLFRGQTTLSLAAAQADGQLRIGHLRLQSPALTANVESGQSDSLEFTANLSDLALLAPDFPGPASVTGTARPDGGDWLVDLNATGPGGTTGTISGRVAENAETVNLALAGTAPLGLANTFIAPRSLLGTLRYDLRVDGKPGLQALSGVISTTDARLAAPTLGLALSNIGATINLSGGRAVIDLTARSSDGGTVSVAGPVGLSAPNEADLRIVFNRFVLRDPALYQTSLSGQVDIRGPLQGGGTIRGTLELGHTEVQVPSTGLSATGTIPDNLTHVNEAGDVRATRARAGLLGSGDDGDGSGGGGLGLGLDIRIIAANQIFVRGRGLDAELGGQLRLVGTTSNVIPIGRFDLVRGRLDVLTKRLTLTDGQIRLEGRFSPYIRLVAESRAEDIDIQVIVEGPVDAPEVRFESTPELPQDEVLARLLFGRGIATLSPFQAAQLAGAVSTLAGRGGGGLVSQLRRNFGLDDLDVSSDAEGATSLRAGKYLSENIYTDVTVDSAGKSEINLNLDVINNVTVKGSADSLGDTSLGIFYERDY